MTRYARLKTGEWGVKTDLHVRIGDHVLVTKKDGTTTTEEIAEVLWKWDRIRCCRIVSKSTKGGDLTANNK
jgi:hypothetical protein